MIVALKWTGRLGSSLYTLVLLISFASHGTAQSRIFSMKIDPLSELLRALRIQVLSAQNVVITKRFVIKTFKNINSLQANFITIYSIPWKRNLTKPWIPKNEYVQRLTWSSSCSLLQDTKPNVYWSFIMIISAEYKHDSFNSLRCWLHSAYRKYPKHSSWLLCSVRRSARSFLFWFWLLCLLYSVYFSTLSVFILNKRLTTRSVYTLHCFCNLLRQADNAWKCL